VLPLDRAAVSIVVTVVNYMTHINKCKIRYTLRERQRQKNKEKSQLQNKTVSYVFLAGEENVGQH
jgi:hypothetical protein